ncbi:MAG: hypothetical protein V4702_02775 [Patescibacteria group bacterium]
MKKLRSRPAITSSIWPDDLRAKTVSGEGGVPLVRRTESEAVLDVKGWSDDEVIAGRLLRPKNIGQSGFIPLIIFILFVLIVGIIVVYMRVSKAQS